jgi:predicted Holliday junction resolvase-like endonuclease
MAIIISLLIGIIVGSTITYYFIRKTDRRKISRDYESQIRILREEHQRAIKQAKDRSIDGSRAVIKGQIAEQLAPVLPEFKYLPSDAKFVGDPIDYIVFDGYTDIKDNGGAENNLEIVILEIKTGQASLSPHQKAIEKAINAGRVRFEVVRLDISKQKDPTSKTKLSPQTLAHRIPGIEDIRKIHPRAYEPWSEHEDDRLRRLFRQGVTIEQLSVEFQRQSGGIRSRLQKLRLIT